jgi:ligand-binding sensor domain-containing protein
MINTHSNYPLKVLTKDGLFYKFNTGSSTKQRFVEKLTIDGDGNPWFSVPGIGVVGYFTNGTIEDPSDDNYKILNKGESTGALPNNDVTDIILTKDNKLWITTSLGFSILSNPSSVANAPYGGYNTYRPKVNYKGDTEYFFGETSISCGTVDGGNRKWLGTDNAGLFCLAEDGYSIIYEFNTSNSKLISNTIYDIEFNGKTGELFVLTDLGLVSLRTDASDGRDDYKEVIVFPNPVQPEYDGVVTIQGIKTDSDVKVTDMAGNIVYETTSNGGTATWNCRKINGEEVATGVYLIWTAPKEGKGRKVGKVTVIR